MNTPTTNNAEYFALFINLLKSLEIFILYYCNQFETVNVLLSVYPNNIQNFMPMNCRKIMNYMVFDHEL